MGKRKGVKRKTNSDEAGTDQAVKGQMGAPEFDPARALIALHPHRTHIAAALGAVVHVRSLKGEAPRELPGADQQLAIRSLTFDKQGLYLLVAGDSKICCAWSCTTWNVVLRSIAPKKISAATFTADSKHVITADKFGDLYVAAIPQGSQAEAGEGLVSKPHMLLGHFSSIVTTLTVPQRKSWLVSTDREGKIRVSKLPKDLSQGAPSVQSFCMGHTSFVTSLSIVETSTEILLVSGSGDGTIRVWDPEDGKQLDCFDTAVHLEQSCSSMQDQSEVGKSQAGPSGQASREGGDIAEQMPKEVGNLASHGCEEDIGQVEELSAIRIHDQLPPAVVALAISQNGATLLAAVEGESSLMVFGILQQKLHLKGRRALQHLSLPTSLTIDSEGSLWVAEGCSGKVSFAGGILASSSFNNALEDYGLQRHSLLETVSALLSPQSSQEALPAIGAAAIAGTQVSLELRKWCYSAEEIMRRKNKRSDIVAA